MTDDYGFPVRPWCPGKPVLQEASEAQDRCDERHKRMDMNPMPFDEIDWEQRRRDYEAIEAGEKLRDFGGGGTIQPGDAFVPHKEK